MAINLGDVKKKKIRLIDSSNNTLLNYNNVAPISKSNKNGINLADVKSGKVKLTPISSTVDKYNLDGSKKLPSSINLTNNNLLKEGQKNKLNQAMQQDLSNKLLSTSNQNKIDLSGKSYLKDTGKTYGDYYYNNYVENKDKKIYLNSKDGNYYLNNNGKYEKLGTGLTTNVTTMTTLDSKDNQLEEAKKQGYKGSQSTQKLNSYLNEVSKKTGYSVDELYNIASDYENKKWDSTKPKYENINVRLNSAGYKAFEVANTINKLAKESSQDTSTIITNELFPKEELPWYKKIVKGSEVFDDGYNFGDVSKTVGATVGDAAANIAEGFLNSTEGLSDTIQYGVADALEGMNFKDAAKSVRNNAKFNSTAAIMGKNEKKEDNFVKGWAANLNKNSVLGEFTNTINQGIGNIGSLAGTTYLTGGQPLSSFLSSFTSAYGNAKSDAYNNGADDKMATQTAIVSGLSEAISEQIFDGIPGLKSAGWGEKFVGKVGSATEKYFGTKTGKFVMGLLDSSGEGFEEIISNMLTATGNNIMHSIDNSYNYGMENQTGNYLEDIKNAALSEESLETFISASLTSALVSGANTFLTTSQKNTIIKTYAEENDLSFNQAKELLNQEIDLRLEKIKTNDLKEKVDAENNVQNQILNEMRQDTYVADDRIVLTPEEVEPVVENNASNKLSKKEIQAIAKEINNQQSEKINKTVEIPKRVNYTGDSNLSFSEQVDKWKKGEYNKNSHLVVAKQTPKIYQELGLNDLPITLVANKLDRIYNFEGKQRGRYHGLNETIKNLPKALEKPLNIVESTTDSNSIVVVTDLSDSKNDIVIASIKIDGNGQIEIENVSKNIPANVLTSAYGRENYDYQTSPVNNDFTGWMEQNRQNNRIIYDIDDGVIKKRINGQWLDLPNSNNSLSKLDVKDRVQFPMRDSSSNSTSDIPKNISPISNNNGTTKTKKSQIAPISSQYSMQQDQKNSIPTYKDIKKSKEKKVPISKNLKKRQEYKKIADSINEIIKKDNQIIGQEVKQRKWIETSLESDALKDKVFIDDLDSNKINYVVQSNQKQLDMANEKLNLLGYDESLNYIRAKVNDDKITLNDIVLAERLIQESIKKGDTATASELIMDTALLGTDLGQKVQALSMIQRLTPEGQLKMFQKIVNRAKAMGDKSFNNVEITPEMVELILNAYDSKGNFNQDDLNSRVEQFKQEIANQLTTTVGEKIDAWRYLSMLGNPKTHIRNVVSNVAMKGAITYKNAIARTLEGAFHIENRTKTWKKASETVVDFAEKTANEMKSVITGESKYGEKASIEAKKQIFKNNTLEKISNFNSNALEFEDWLFSKSAFKNAFKQYLTANGIQTTEDIKNNSEIIEKAKLHSVQQAEIATFRQYSKLASTINRIEKNNKFAKYPVKATLPFKKTPINVAKAGVNYSPIGLIKNVTYDVYQLKQGNIEASEFIDNLSQGITGTSLSLIGYALAKAGILTGSGGDDKDDKFDSYLGKQSYSIKIGKSYYSLSWLSPTAMPLLVGANAYEQLENDKGWDMNVITEALAKTLDPLNEMSFLSGLTDALNSYGSGTDKIKGVGESVMQSYIGQFFPTLFSQIAGVSDNTKRSTKASSNSSYKFGEQTIRSVMYKLPGLRNKLEPSTDIWGNEIKQNKNILIRALDTFIVPYSKKTYVPSKTDKEIIKVYDKTGNTGVIPGIPNSYFTYDKAKYRMSSKEYTNFKKTYGTSANEMLNILINSSVYKNSSDKKKANMIKKVYDNARDLSKIVILNNRNVKYDKDDFEYTTSDYEKIVQYILDNTREVKN